ncbi:aminoglycoside phosphotransferase [Microbacterium lacticum]|uniref:maltokinase N-terminal cap-like domain-containing protein n=1 Tax=Microbacterium lacticum TaxID=33885 RepID=UPI0028D2041B|nr:aminoglycoside phosphotransferase [Microbacterium lacticum]
MAALLITLLLLNAVFNLVTWPTAQASPGAPARPHARTARRTTVGRMHGTLALLTAWLARQRWFAGTAASPRLRVLADRELATDDPAARVRLLVLVDEAPEPRVVYQVPLVERATAGVAAAGEGFIGLREDGVALIDGPHDPAFTAALLSLVAPAAPPSTAEVLRGEQSNTSIIFRAVDPAPDRTPVICKVFRVLHPGLNPDIELQSALSAAGSPHVPRVVGRLDGSWRDPDFAAEQADAPNTLDAPDAALHGSLAFAQEFYPGVEDAWRVALRSARGGVDFADAADALGRATADVHLDLARLFPHPEATPDQRATLVAAWHRRLRIALAEVPQLAPWADDIRHRYTAAEAAPWPRLQRVHGDYHLGQVLQVPGRGWVLLDFEGEPMRPMGERSAPDLALRDVAGMLRSFDYVEGSLTLARSQTTGLDADARGLDAQEDADDDRARAWAVSARTAFLAGYRAGSGASPEGALLDALELDKAVYEAIYEARHRPAWLPIPLAAVARLATR